MTDVGQYCRDVEHYLTRVNGGHLVRIVGPGFELVRRWADEGVPLSVVYRGIEMKADRQRAAHERAALPVRDPRPLRIEFCASDVREVYESWRRAVGLPAAPQVPADGDLANAAEPSGEGGSPPDRRRASLSKHLERIIDRLGRAVGRVDLPEALRDRLASILDEIAKCRESARGVRGEAREEIAAKLGPIDRAMLEAARAAVDAATLADLTHEAERDLDPFRGRLPAASWDRAVDATVDRLLRDRFGLPSIEF